MTEAEQGSVPAWLPVLTEFSRASSHELRNALNALVVNLEVVRSRADQLDASVKPFLLQAVDQGEESVRLAEGTIALLDLLIASIGGDGSLAANFHEPRSITLQAGRDKAERAARALRRVAERAGATVETSESAVILSFPSDRQEKQR